LGKFEVPLPDGVYLSETLIYKCNDMYIGMPRTEMSFQPGTHSHDGYEFMLPLTDMPFLIVNNKICSGRKNDIFVLNPWQEHGAAQQMLNNRFINILISKAFMEKTAEEVFNTKSVEFCNSGHTSSRRIHNIVSMFFDEAAMNLPGRSLIMESLRYTITVHLLREVKNNLSSPQGINFNDSTHRIKNVLEYMKDNYSNDCSLKELAEIADMSSYHLIRVFKNTVGKTPYEYLLDLKIDKVKTLLRKKDKTILEACLECGFNDVSHFTRLFKKKTGVTPSAYRTMMID
jgi:AraC family transcriptional regulator